MAPKKTKMALGDFMSMGGGTDGPTNWADEMDSIVLPTAPGQYNPATLPPFKRPAGMEGGGFGGQGGDYDSRPPRADVPFPTQPPYTAFIGNMSFESTADDVKDFFSQSAGLTPLSVRTVSGYDGKPKGFCYAEFAEPDMLKAALDLSGSDLGGRAVRIGVAEPPRGGESGRSAGDWTRSGPLPDIPGSRGGMGMSRAGPPSSGGAGAGGDSGRDWGDVRGGKFAPSAPASPSMGGGSRPAMTGRPGGSFRERDISAGAGSAASPAGEDRDWTAARGGRFAPSVPPTPSTSTDRRAGFSALEGRTNDNETSDWRARAKPSPASPALSDASSGQAAAAATPAAPVERKKLQLAARSSTPAAATATSPPASASSSSSSKANPFGAAAPVDTAAREQALLEARMEKERAAAEERRKKIEADQAAAAAKKTAGSNPFGDAKPVDVSQREKEVEEKEKSRKDKDRDEGVTSATKAMGDAKIVEEKSAAPKKEWRRPSGPNAGLTNSQASAPQSQNTKKGSGSSTTHGDVTKQGTPTPAAIASTPRQIAKNAGIRKEGFSYSNVARGGGNAKPPTAPIASDSIVPDNVPVKSKGEEQAAIVDKPESAATTEDGSESKMSAKGDSVTET